VFSSRSLRTLGKYSYCLYIVHYPLMVVMDLVWSRVHIPQVMGSQLPSWLAYGAVLGASSFAAAWVSWRLLEAPMLAMKERLRFGAARAVESTSAIKQPASAG
jgi:peptidoglycan/LPS O-acetylase OafA/YrhL